MKYWPGLVMLAVGGWLLYTALVKRRQVLAARQQASAEGRTTPVRTNPRLLALAAVMQPIVTFALLFVGAVIVAVYVATDLARDFFGGGSRRIPGPACRLRDLVSHQHDLPRRRRRAR